jgi:hypothetical protein
VESSVLCNDWEVTFTGWINFHWHTWPCKFRTPSHFQLSTFTHSVYTFIYAAIDLRILSILNFSSRLSNRVYSYLILRLHNFYSSPSTIRMIKSRRMRWAGHVAHMR